MKRQYLLERWNEYRHRVFEPDEPCLEIDRARLHYYAGAMSMHSILRSIFTRAAESKNTELWHTEVDEVVEELNRFTREIIGRRQ